MLFRSAFRGGTLARHEIDVLRFDYTQKIRVWGAHPAPDATRPVARADLVNKPRPRYEDGGQGSP